MLIQLSSTQAPVVLAAMRDVASAGGTQALSPADTLALTSFAQFVLRLADAAPIPSWPVVTPADVARALSKAADRDHVLQFLVVMALVDGTVDTRKIAVVERYALALDVTEDAVDQLAHLGQGNLAWVRADVARQNLKSITGHVVTDSIDAWIQPYRDGHADPALSARYRALGNLPAGTLGRTFCEFYRDNGFVFAGEPQGLNERFASPHDSTHILSGYDTSPQGELLVSTFTAGMHPCEPMSGHILPVILSWHLGIELAKLPGEITGQLDPPKFWNAWERGSAVRVDVFADAWDFWKAAAQPLDALRTAYGVPPLDAQYAAHGDVPVWYKPIA